MIRQITGWAILCAGILVFAICTALLDLAWDQDPNWDPGIHAPGLLWGCAAGMIVSGVGMGFMPWNRRYGPPPADELAERKQRREWEDANPPGLAQFCCFMAYLAAFAVATGSLKTYLVDDRPWLAAAQFMLGVVAMISCGTLHDRVPPAAQPDPVIVGLHQRTHEAERRLSAYAKSHPRTIGFAKGTMTGMAVMIFVPILAWSVFPGIADNTAIALAGITGLALAFMRLKGNKR
jgi:hypothetical protein